MKADSLSACHKSTGKFGSSFATLGRTAVLSVSALRHLITDVVRLRLSLGDVIQQAWFLYTVTALPALLMAIPFGVIVNLQIGGLLNDVGAQSMTGAVAGIGILRQGAPICAALLMGGAAASAIASDLASRSVREEIDAMRVLGIDPVQRLVVPRLLAMFVVAPMILATVILVGLGSAYLVAVTFGNVSPGSFWSSFGTYATTTDLIFALAKVLVSGLLVVVISSLRGMETRGGPREVAESVNAAVVLSIVASVFAVLVLTQVQNVWAEGPSA